MNKILAGLFSGLMAVFLPACDGINMAKLKPGISTVQDVREIMGPPTMEWQDADGTLTWEYPRTPQGIVNYMIEFGPDKVLREIRQVLTEENFGKVHAGMSRRMCAVCWANRRTNSTSRSRRSTSGTGKRKLMRVWTGISTCISMSRGVCCGRAPISWPGLT